MIKRKAAFMIFSGIILLAMLASEAMPNANVHPFKEPIINPSLTPHAPMIFTSNGAIAAEASAGIL